jgi:amino acid permease
VVRGLEQRLLSPPLIFATKSHSSIIIIVIMAINILGVAFFGEIEFWMSTCKVLVLVGLLLLGIILDLGGGPTHDRIGFRYWKSEYAPVRVSRSSSSHPILQTPVPSLTTSTKTTSVSSWVSGTRSPTHSSLTSVPN